MIRNVLYLTAGCLVFVMLLTVCSDRATTTTTAPTHRRNLLFALGEDNDIPPLSAYKISFVCLDTTFTHPNVDDCTDDKLITFTAELNPTGPNAFRYHNKGPMVTRGTFWTSGLRGSDSLITFAETPRVGGYVSTGVLELDPQGYHYRLRSRGDRSIAFADKDYVGVGSIWDSTALFRIVRGTVDEPEKFVIDNLSNFGILPFRIYLTWWYRLINGNYMELISDPNHPKKQEFPYSTIWHRRSYFLFFKTIDYYAVQVINGDGQQVTLAYDAWKAYQQSDVAGQDPNWNHFDYLRDDYNNNNMG